MADQDPKPADKAEKPNSSVEPAQAAPAGVAQGAGVGFAPALEEAPAVEEEKELSLEELDALLATEDPDFAKQVTKIQADTHLSLSDIDLDSLDEALYQETQIWRQSGGWKSVLYRIYPDAPRRSLQWKHLVFKTKRNGRALWIRFKNYLYFLATDGRRALVQSLLLSLKKSFLRLKESLLHFGQKPLKVKLLFFLSLMLLSLTGSVTWWMLKHGLNIKDSSIFLSNFEGVADRIYTYDPEGEVEAFYDNLRSAPNLIYLEKLVVNLRRTKNAGENPMGAFEFFLEGLSPEVVVEVKDRETPVKDVVQRTLEEFSFEELDSTEGKHKLCERLSRNISRILTTGKLKSVRIKTIVLKP